MRIPFYTLFLAVMIIGSTCYGQSEPQYSHYMYHRQLVNPAYVGSMDAVEFDLLYRTQYVGLSDRVTSTQYMGFNMPLAAISSGVGLSVTNDMIGYLRTTAVNVNYDYRKKLGFGSLGLGIGLGIIQTGLQGGSLLTPDGGIGGTQRDPVVPQSSVGIITPDFSVGVYLSNGDKYFAGVALDHIYSVAKFSFTNSISQKLQNSQINYTRNLLLTGGYEFQISKHWAVMPSALIKTDLREAQIDISATMRVYDNIMTGIALRGYSARSLDAAILYAGFRVKSLRIMYSYDINTSYLKGFNTGSHEISLRVDLKMKNKVKTGYFYHNPRYL